VADLSPRRDHSSRDIASRFTHFARLDRRWMENYLLSRYRYHVSRHRM